MERPQQYRRRPRLACEVTVSSVIAARASEKTRRLDLFASRRLAPGVISPSLGGANVQDAEALRTAISGALGAVSGTARVTRIGARALASSSRVPRRLVDDRAAREERRRHHHEREGPAESLKGLHRKILSSRRHLRTREML